MSYKFFTASQLSPYQGEEVRNSQIIQDCYSSVLDKYQAASNEKSFAVLKGYLFFTDNALLQCPERIGALDAAKKLN